MFLDTFFDGEESIDDPEGGYCDPLRPGKSIDKPLWGPRHYFLDTFEVRVRWCKAEWEKILAEFTSPIKESVSESYPALGLRQNKYTRAVNHGHD